MFVCVVPLSQPSSRDLLYVKCLCVLSRYLSPVVEICYMLNVCVCVVTLSQPSSRDLVYPLLGCFVPEKKSIKKNKCCCFRWGGVGHS